MIPEPRPEPFTPRRRDPWLRRIAAWRDDPRAGALVLGAIAVAAGFYWYRGASRIPAAPATAVVTTTSVAGAAEDFGATTAPPTIPVPSVVVVHVAGAVVRPGVVSLSSGARVVDAIDAAGGPRADADLDRLNLAAPVADGDRVLVARVGDPPTPALPTGGAHDVTDPAAGAGSVGPVDLNTATLAELEELPGIGPTLAAAIIAERDRRGGFGSVDDLRSVRGIGDARFADLRDLVVV